MPFPLRHRANTSCTISASTGLISSFFFTASAQTQHHSFPASDGASRPGSKELDYLVDFPGFQAAYGVPIQFPEPDQAGWALCPEPSHTDPLKGSVELATQINHAIEKLQSSYAPHVVLIYFPDRWNHLRVYRVERERFDVHAFHDGVIIYF